jgi:hypothetical protein
MFLYYPGHRQVPAPLRALIDMIRVSSSAAARKRPALVNPFAVCAEQASEPAVEDRFLSAGGAKLQKELQPPEPAQ